MDTGLDWNTSTTAHRSRGWGLRHADCEPVDSDDPAALPLVKAARDQGFEPAPEAPLWCFLPAIWPERERTWVRDTRIRHMSVACDGQPSRRVPWPAREYAELEADTNDLLTECGIPPRPAGRLWLLRPPTGHSSLDDVLRRLVGAAEAAGDDVMASPGFVAHVDAELRSLFDGTPERPQP